jgi:hypothetical protein
MLEKLADSLSTGSPTEQALGQKFRKIAKEILASEEIPGLIKPSVDSFSGINLF